MTPLKISIVLVSVLLWSCGPSTERTNDRGDINTILHAHGLPMLPSGARSLSGITVKHRQYVDYDIHFICATVECAKFIAQVPGAPAHDNSVTQQDIVNYLETGPPGQVLRDRHMDDEPNYTYIMTKRRPDGALEVTIEFEDIH